MRFVLHYPKFFGFPHENWWKGGKWRVAVRALKYDEISKRAYYREALVLNYLWIFAILTSEFAFLRGTSNTRMTAVSSHKYRWRGVSCVDRSPEAFTSGSTYSLNWNSISFLKKAPHPLPPKIWGPSGSRNVPLFHPRPEPGQGISTRVLFKSIISRAGISRRFSISAYKVIPGLGPVRGPELHT